VHYYDLMYLNFRFCYIRDETVKFSEPAGHKYFLNNSPFNSFLKSHFDLLQSFEGNHGSVVGIATGWTTEGSEFESR
jgi:hypothetical protein